MRRDDAGEDGHQQQEYREPEPDQRAAVLRVGAPEFGERTVDPRNRFDADFEGFFDLDHACLIRGLTTP